MSIELCTVQYADVGLMVILHQFVMAHPALLIPLSVWTMCSRSLYIVLGRTALGLDALAVKFATLSLKQMRESSDGIQVMDNQTSFIH